MVDREMLAAMADLLEDKLENLQEEMDRKLESLEERMDQKLGSLETRMNQKLDEKLEPIHARLDKLDEKLIPIHDRLDKLEIDMKKVRVDQLEYQIIPLLNEIGQTYHDTANRYLEKMDQIDEMAMDIAVMKCTIENHSDRLNRLSV